MPTKKLFTIALCPLDKQAFVCYIVTMKATTELEYQDYGSKLIVAITGKHEDVEAQFNSFYNWQATENPEIFWATDTRGYFYTTTEKLLKAMTNAELFRVLNDCSSVAWKGVKGGAMALAKELAQDRFDAMKQNPRSRGVVCVDYHNLGTIGAENLSDSDA